VTANPEVAKGNQILRFWLRMSGRRGGDPGRYRQLLAPKPVAV
jgi:hypothetical protein